MGRAESDAGSSKRDEEMRGSPAYQATLKEMLSLRARAIGLIQRQVNDLKGAGTTPEQNELLEHLDLTISIAASLSRYANASLSDPFTMDDPALKRILVDAALLLSQHEDKGLEG